MSRQAKSNFLFLQGVYARGGGIRHFVSLGFVKTETAILSVLIVVIGRKLRSGQKLAGTLFPPEINYRFQELVTLSKSNYTRVQGIYLVLTILPRYA